jgi:hypothetical protein
LRALATSPRIYARADFLSPDECGRLLTVAAAFGSQHPDRRHDSAGLSFELPLDADPLVADVAARVERLLGFANRVPGTLRFRTYEPGDSHPPHRDEYAIDGHRLIVTAMLNLADTAAGGETYFPAAIDGELRLPPRAGELLLWFNHRRDGSIDPRGMHEGLPVVAGSKTTLTQFLYAPVELAASVFDSEAGHFVFDRSSAPERPPSFWCIDDGVPESTVSTLRAACEARDIPFEIIEPGSFDWDPARRLQPGDLLYRAAISLAGIRVEQFLHGPGVATFYKDADDGIFFDASTYPLHFERAGLPVPRTIYCATTNRALLRSFVDQLGGFPIVLKFTGGSRGVGVIQVDSQPALVSLVDYALSQGRNPLLCAYVDNAVHWRVVVVGDRAVAAYRNPTDEDDFRTYGSDAIEDFTATPDPELAALAIRAVHTLRLEFGGVDILEHASGRYYVLESNFPCYFAHAQLVAGIDVAGAMVDHLQEKAARLVRCEKPA